MAIRIVVFLCVLAIADGQLGLPCMQKDTIKDAVTRCFSGLGERETSALGLTGQSGTLGQVAEMVSDASCSHIDDLVNGLDCYLNFTGECLNIRKMLPSRFNLVDTFTYGCQHVAELQDSCLATLVKNMLACYLGKVKDRQMAILLGKSKPGTIEQETCSFLKEEIKCVKTVHSMCTQPVRDVFTTYMNKLIPNSCRYPGLLEVLKNTDKLRGMSLTRVNTGPR